MRFALTGIFLIASAGSGAAQAVTEWSTSRGVPVAVVEVPGGDVAHVAAVVPGSAPLPPTVAGHPLEVRAHGPALVATVTAPALTAGPALGELLAALTPGGVAALVVLGGVSARELGFLPAAAEGLPFAGLPRRPCLVAEGEVVLLRGTAERLELFYPLPGPADPRFDLLPALEGWVRRRLAARWPAISTAMELKEGCARLALRLASPADHPRALLGPLREAVRELAAAVPTGEEVEAVASQVERRRAGWAVDGRGAAVDLALRRAEGGRAAAALAPPLLDAGALANLAREVLGGHSGEAVLVERERRPVEDAPEVLENGVQLAWRWVASTVGTVAVALGGVEPGFGLGVLEKLAGDAAREGWHTLLDTLAGVPALAMAVPADDLPAALEMVAVGLVDASENPTTGDEVELARGLGLAATLSGSSVAVAVAAPAESELVREAAAKFFSGLPPTTVRSSVPLAPGLVHTQAEGMAMMLAAVEVPPSAAGWLAGEVAARRLERLVGARTRWLAPAGRLVLEVAVSGEGHVLALDTRLAEVWGQVRAAASTAEAKAAAAVVRAALYGDAARAGLRAATTPFLPAVPGQAELLGVDSREVSEALAALPVWAEIPRLGRGPAPLLVTPPPRPAVRQSPPRRPRGP